MDNIIIILAFIIGYYLGHNAQRRELIERSKQIGAHLFQVVQPKRKIKFITKAQPQTQEQKNMHELQKKG